MKRFGWVSLVILLTAVSAVDAANRFENTKPKGVYLGFGFGAASASLSTDYWGNEPESKGAFAVAMRAGFIVRRNLLIGTESAASLYRVADRYWQYTSAVVALTYYPSPSLFLRGGVGFGSVQYERREFGPWNSSVQAGGLAAHASIGLDISTSRSFSILPTIRGDYVNMDPESYYQIALTIDIGWYW